MLLTSRTSRADTYRSSVSPVGTNPSDPHLSGPTAAMVTSGDFSTRSGFPIVHPSLSSKRRGGGMSAGVPRGAPPSAHFAIFATSSSLRDGASLKFWVPIFFSMNQGGSAPRRHLRPVRPLHDPAPGPSSAYEILDL